MTSKSNPKSNPTPAPEFTLAQLETMLASAKKEAKERAVVPAAECIVRGYRHLAYAVLEARKAMQKKGAIPPSDQQSDTEESILEVLAILGDILGTHKYDLPRMQLSKTDGMMEGIELIPLTK